MPANKITKEEYLNKDFDYSKLTKQELRQILSENDVEDIPPLTALKSTILDAYKRNIHDRIVHLKNKFSSENIFQTERKTRKDADMSSMSHKASSFEDSLIQESASEQVNDSEVNSTSFNRTPKFKHPFIAIPKRKADESMISEKIESSLDRSTIVESRSAKKRRFPVLKLFMLAILACGVYFKFFCPYCKLGLTVCIPVPPHSRLENDALVCDDGYKLVKSLVDICVADNQQERDILIKINSYVKMLEYLKGDYRYGLVKSPKIKLSHLTSDSKVISGMLKSPKTIISNDFIESKAIRVSFRTFFKFYSFRLLKISIGILVLFITFRVWLNRRRRASMLNTQAVSTSKDILDVLNRQIMMSIKSSQFKPYVYEEQMKDALEVKDDVWPFIKSLVEKNSNVEKQTDESGRVAWKWIGPVLYKTDAIDA